MSTSLSLEPREPSAASIGVARRDQRRCRPGTRGPRTPRGAEQDAERRRSVLADTVRVKIPSSPPRRSAAPTDRSRSRAHRRDRREGRPRHLDGLRRSGLKDVGGNMTPGAGQADHSKGGPMPAIAGPGSDHQSGAYRTRALRAGPCPPSPAYGPRLEEAPGRDRAMMPRIGQGEHADGAPALRSSPGSRATADASPIRNHPVVASPESAPNAGDLGGARGPPVPALAFSAPARVRRLLPRPSRRGQSDTPGRRHRDARALQPESGCSSGIAWRLHGQHQPRPRLMFALAGRRPRDTAQTRIGPISASSMDCFFWWSGRCCGAAAARGCASAGGAQGREGARGGQEGALRAAPPGTSFGTRAFAAGIVLNMPGVLLSARAPPARQAGP